MTPSDITILGAGIAGLSVARALSLRGWRVTVLEQTASFGETGAGLQISPNGAAVLHALGLGDALDGASIRGRAVELRRGSSGAKVLRLDVSDQRYHMIHRADLIGLLADGATEAGARIVMGGRAHDAPGYVIGADGMHSRLRGAIGGASQAFFTGHVAWRAVIPAEPGAEAVAEIHMGPGRHLVSYPLRGGMLRNIVAVERRKAWAEESWTLRDDARNLRAAFATFSPRVRGWLDRVDEPWLWGLFRHEVARLWHDERRVILGDAAHPTLPFMAQGANLALEDAWVLADCLNRHPDFVSATTAYQRIREGRVRKVVAAANANVRVYHLPPPIAPVAHAVMRLGGVIAPKAPLRRFDWIYRHDVTR